MADLMPTRKIWTSPEGVQIEYVTYRTILIDRIRDALEHVGIDVELNAPRMFIVCAASTTNVILPETPPLWGQILHEMVTGGQWLRNAAGDYNHLAYAPSELMTNWFNGHLATRTRSHDAPAELQRPGPLKPDEEADGEEAEDSPTQDAVPSSNILSLTKSGKQSRKKTRPAS